MQRARVQHADRRRRILLDQQVGGSETVPASGSRSEPEARRSAPSSAARAYSTTARDEFQWCLSELIPRRNSSWWILAGAAAVVALALWVLHALPLVWSLSGAFDHWYGTDWFAAGSLGAWFASVEFAALAVLSILIYRIRRHRRDDYRGRYRVWLWAAGVLTAASLLSGTGAHRLLDPLGRWAAIGVLAGVFGVSLLRLAIEVRRCRAALAFLVVTGLLYGAALYPDPDTSLPWPTVEELALLTLLVGGHLGLWLGLTRYARFVRLDAEDGHREGRRSRSAAQEADVNRPARRKKKNTVGNDRETDTPSPEDGDSDRAESPDPKTSWAQRRKLRAEERAQRRADRRSERERARSEASEQKQAAREEARRRRSEAKASKKQSVKEKATAGRPSGKETEPAGAGHQKRKSRSAGERSDEAPGSGLKKSRGKKTARRSAETAGREREARVGGSNDGGGSEGRMGGRNGAAAESEQEPSESETRRLSKSERKRLRRERRRQQEAAATSQHGNGAA